jgi:hypothetical protein
LHRRRRKLGRVRPPWSERRPVLRDYPSRTADLRRCPPDRPIESPVVPLNTSPRSPLPFVPPSDAFLLAGPTVLHWADGKYQPPPTLASALSSIESASPASPSARRRPTRMLLRRCIRRESPRSASASSPRSRDQTPAWGRSRPLRRQPFGLKNLSRPGKGRPRGRCACEGERPLQAEDHRHQIPPRPQAEAVQRSIKAFGISQARRPGRAKTILFRSAALLLTTIILLILYSGFVHYRTGQFYTYLKSRQPGLSGGVYTTDSELGFASVPDRAGASSTRQGTARPSAGTKTDSAFRSTRPPARRRPSARSFSRSGVLIHSAMLATRRKPIRSWWERPWEERRGIRGSAAMGSPRCSSWREGWFRG